MPARGRPRGTETKPWQEAIRKAVSKREKDGGKSLDRLAEKLVAKANEGEGWAFQEIGNRLDGKAHQSTDVTFREERMVVDAPQPVPEADEWANKHKPVH